MANHSFKDTVLFDKIASKIAKNGPLSLARFISIALGDTDHGYYIKKDPFGAAGDFTTAPEISGLFGEMCGLYLAHMYKLSGLDDPAIIELGPGRGTLMADMRHVWQRTMPCLETAPVHLIETSPKLRQAQQTLLSGANIFWHSDLDNLPKQPIFAIANEFFDALPVAHAIWRQNTQDSTGIWRHRLVGLNDGRLVFIDGPPLSADELRAWALDISQTDGSDHLSSSNIRNGTIAEYCPLAITLTGKIAHHLVTYGGACLIVDYGQDGQSGDSLQAVANHQPVDVFHQPGNTDLSHWVDFSAIRRAAEKAGARLVGPVTQGNFLRNIGIFQRSETAAKLANQETRRGLYAAVDRLVNNQHMGSAFKVALMLPPGFGLPPGFAISERAKCYEQC